MPEYGLSAKERADCLITAATRILPLLGGSDKIARRLLNTSMDYAFGASVATQRRLHNIIEILDRAIPCAGSGVRAFVWYRSQTLPSFGDQTAEDLVKTGRAEAVKCHLEKIVEGGFT